MGSRRTAEGLALCCGEVVDQVTEGLVFHEALEGYVLAWVGHALVARIEILAMAKGCLEGLYCMIKLVHFCKRAGQIVVEYRIGRVGLYPLFKQGFCLLETAGHSVGHP